MLRHLIPLHFSKLSKATLLFSSTVTHTFGIRFIVPPSFSRSSLCCWQSVFPFHSISLSPSLRDVLPFTLKLPEAIASAKTSAELEEVAKLGTGLFPLFLLNIYVRGSLWQAEGDVWENLHILRVTWKFAYRSQVWSLQSTETLNLWEKNIQ